jgi:hypothetical protein
MTSLQKTKVGYIYSTVNAGWKSLKLTGSNLGGVTFFGGVHEGIPSAAATVPLIEINGGTWKFVGTMFDYVSSSGNNGAILQTGGEVDFDLVTYVRDSAAAETWPLLYQTGGLARLKNPIAGTAGEFVYARWSDSQVTKILHKNRDNVSQVLDAAEVTGAVNRLAISNAAAGGAPQIACTGDDANIEFGVAPKGNAPFVVRSGATGVAATIQAKGPDANHDFNLFTKGTGILKCNGNAVGVKVPVPASASATGVLGQWAADNSWHYVCVAANTWMRHAIATW